MIVMDAEFQPGRDSLLAGNDWQDIFPAAAILKMQGNKFSSALRVAAIMLP
jgi:hypothetical protein